MSFVTVLITLYLISGVHAQKRVLAVIFLEADVPLSKLPPILENIALQKLKFVQKQFLLNFGSTFALDGIPVRFVNADHGGEWYVKTRPSFGKGRAPNKQVWRMLNIRQELVQKLPLNADVRLVVYPTSKRDGYVAAYTSEPIGQGAYVDFDDLTCGYGKGESSPFPDEVQAVCGGVELHEMGHVFGLGHTGPPDDCMQQGYFKNYAPRGGYCQFSYENRLKVQQSQKEWLRIKGQNVNKSPICNNGVCCAGSCGKCGGAGCSGRLGGKYKCCPQYIQEKGIVCNNKIRDGCVQKSGMPQSGPTPPGSSSNQCGKDYRGARDCHRACPIGIDSECPSGERCYAKVPCPGRASRSPPVSPSRSSPGSPSRSSSNQCGRDYRGARDCHRACPIGIDSECPSGERCYAKVPC